MKPPGVMFLNDKLSPCLFSQLWRGLLGFCKVAFSPIGFKAGALATRFFAGLSNISGQLLGARFFLRSAFVFGRPLCTFYTSAQGVHQVNDVAASRCLLLRNRDNPFALGLFFDEVSKGYRIAVLEFLRLEGSLLRLMISVARLTISGSVLASANRGNRSGAPLVRLGIA